MGLLLPNVALTGDASAFVLQSTAGEPEKQAAAGMLVYNTAHVLKGPGLYVWNGASWMALRENPNSITDDRDGNWYSTGDFGAAGTWMTMNLRYKGELTWKTNYAYPGKDNSSSNSIEPAVVADEGLLYNWGTTTGITTSANEGAETVNKNHDIRQGICPNGWHVPSDVEWNELEEEIAASGIEVYSTIGPTDWEAGWQTAYAAYRGTHGEKMKSTKWVNNTNPNGASLASDANGFDILLAGLDENTTKPAIEYGQMAFLWSSSSNTGSFAWVRIFHSGTGVNRTFRGKNEFFSVRCKMDNLPIND
ncbi:MAG: hypothetical protein LBH61_03485 [Dysgonamonadaceae bacterium]|nr:hypothetical protein [Dysgonamonadaceae bacterium]